MASKLYWKVNGATNSATLQTSRMTTPAICVRDGSTTKYVNLIAGTSGTNNLHVKYNGTLYSVSFNNPNNWQTGVQVSSATTYERLRLISGSVATNGTGTWVYAFKYLNQGYFSYSTDHGVTWSAIAAFPGVTSNTYSCDWSIAYGNGVFIAAGNQLGVAVCYCRSSDGISWSNAANVPGWSGTGASVKVGYHGVIYCGGSTWLIVGKNGTLSPSVTNPTWSRSIDNGVSWSTAASFAGLTSATLNWVHCGAANGSNIVVAGEGYIGTTYGAPYWTSSNSGASWSSATFLPSVVGNSGGAFGMYNNGSTFITVGYSGYGSTQQGYYSKSTNNGSTWTTTIDSTNNTQQSNIYYNEGLWVMVGHYEDAGATVGQPVYSVSADDGANWSPWRTQIDSLSNAYNTFASDIKFGAGVWMAACYVQNQGQYISRSI